MLETIEQSLRDSIVRALAVPLGDELACVGIDCARVAAADVDSERNVGKALDEGVIGIDGTLEISLGVLATRAHAFQ